MPKELTHIFLANAALAAFSEEADGEVLVGLLESYSDHYLFGTVLHDIAFCASSGKEGERIKDRGMSVHGKSDGDTFGPMHRLASEYEKTKQPELVAILAGALTHYHTDSVFHPFVYYYTGNQISRHYRLETLIDTWFFNHQNDWLRKPVDPMGIYKRLEIKKLVPYLGLFLDLPKSCDDAMGRALKMHRFVLKLFRSRPGSLLFHLVSAFYGGQDYRDKRNLFYPPGMRFAMPMFDHPFSYRHPVTGQPADESLHSLAEKVIEKSCNGFQEIASALWEGRPIELTRFAEPVSLETGMAGPTPETYNYTDLTRSIDTLVSESCQNR